MKTKKEIREHIKALFNKVEREELTEKSEVIQQKLWQSISDKKIKNICIYESLSDEVQTYELIKKLSSAWYNIYTPQVISETEMILIDGEYEVYEKEIDVFIIPGRAFTKNWKRLWRGRWYYDRFFSNGRYKKSRKVWVCFDFQLLNEIETKAHDIDMHKIVTNT